MPAPTTETEYLELVRKSGTVADATLREFSRQRPANAPPKQTADDLVKAGMLTAFQAKQLLLGKSRLTIGSKYLVIDCLGSGGMGTVFLCEHKTLQRLVAIKVLPSRQAMTGGAIERFHREARAVAHLKHPNIVGAYDVDQDGKHHFIVMEYVNGSSLHSIVKNHGPMEILRACHYISQAACGLQHAHEAGLIHRDIKPANLLVDRSGVVRILDLGLARFFHDTTDNLTKNFDADAVLGTADYLAPEQALDVHSADIRADIYALGLTFYFLLAGHDPFEEGTFAQKLLWQQVKQPVPITEVRPEVPAELAGILEKMIAKDPNARFQTPEEVASALMPWTLDPIASPPDKEMPPATVGPSGERTKSDVLASPRKSNPPQAPFLPSHSHKSASRKMLVILAAAAVFLGLAGAGLTWFLVGGKPKESEKQTEAVDKREEAKPKGHKASKTLTWTWLAFDPDGAFVEKAATGVAPTFAIPQGKTLLFATNLASPIRLDAGTSAKVTFNLSVTGGLTEAKGRPFGVGVFRSTESEGRLTSDLGYFALWNPTGPYFESYAYRGGNNLFSGKQLPQGGIYEGKLTDEAEYAMQLLLTMNQSGDGISLGRGNSLDLAGMAATGAGVSQTAYSKLDPVAKGEKPVFDRLVFKFHNTSGREVQLRLGEIKVTSGE